jgi:hypothetical protein
VAAGCVAPRRCATRSDAMRSEAKQNKNMTSNAEISYSSNAIVSRLVAWLLENAKPGELLTWKELNAAAGANLQAKRHLWYAADDILKEDRRWVFDNVQGKGMMLCDDSSIISRRPPKAQKIIRHKASKLAGELSCVKDFSALSNEEKIAHCSAMGTAKLAVHLMKQETRKQIETSIGISANLEGPGISRLLRYLGKAEEK